MQCGLRPCKRDKGYRNRHRGYSEIFLTENRNSFLWPLDLTTLLCEALLGKTLCTGRSSPREVVPPSLDVLVRQPSSGSGGRENEKTRKLRAQALAWEKERRESPSPPARADVFSIALIDHYLSLLESLESNWNLNQ